MARFAWADTFRSVRRSGNFVHSLGICTNGEPTASEGIDKRWRLNSERSVKDKPLAVFVADMKKVERDPEGTR